MRFVRQFSLTVLLAALFIAPSSAIAALAIGASTQAGTAFSAALASPSITTQATGSTFVLVEVTGGGLLAPTDNKANTYTVTPALQALFNTSSQAVSVWICSNCAGGAGHVFTANFTSGVSAAFLVVEITSTGGAFAVLDQNALTSNLNNVTTANTPSVTPAVNNEVILSLIGGNVATNITITDTAGYNNIVTVNGNGASNGTLVEASGGLIQTTAAATHDVFGLSAITNAGVLTLSFLPHSAATSGPNPLWPPKRF